MGSRLRPLLAIVLIGAAFYGALNYLFQFHLIADDFPYQQMYWACAPSCQLSDVVPPAMAIRQPIYLLQYALIVLNPHATNLYYFLFQMLHVFNSLLLFLLLKKQFKDSDRFALTAALLFLFFPNNFEILYWRSCLCYVIGMTFALVGMLWFSWASALLWWASFVIYESFLGLPLMMGLAFFAYDREKVKRFVKVYGLALLMYGLWRIGTSRFAHVELARYPLDLGPFGWNALQRLAGYVYFHFSIRSSQKEYELLSWLFRAIVVYGFWANRSAIRSKAQWIGLLGLVYLVSLVPVSLIGHHSPRGAFGASLIFCVLLAVSVSELHVSWRAIIVALFMAGHVAGARKADFNSKLFQSREDLIQELVTQLPPDACLEVRNFKTGFKKEWFLQIGFDLKLIENKIKHSQPDKKFILTETCPQGATQSIDFAIYPKEGISGEKLN
jgi:hypothetical protein